MKENTRSNPIFVTGAPRSGTTWVGKMLALSKNIGYIHEPFNTDHNIGRISKQFDYRFQYIEIDEKSKYEKLFIDLIDFKYNLNNAINSVKTLQDFGNKIREFGQTAQNRIFNRRPLIKDPIGIFSVPWFCKRFDALPVITIRHPGAVISSFKRLNWQIEFSSIYNQKLLMDNYLSSFKNNLENRLNSENDPIENGILLWNIIYYVVIQYQKEYPNWYFIRHEDISRRPLELFKNLYNKLGIEFSPHIKKEIDLSTSSKNISEVPENSNAMFIKIDSIKNLNNWKLRLTKDEIERIRLGTDKFASHYYSDDEW